MLIFAIIRVAVDALICRLALGCSGRRLWRTTAAVVVADAVIAGFGLLILRWAGTAKLGYGLAGLATTGVALVLALLVWEFAIRLAAGPEKPSRRRVGGAAAALLLSALFLGVAAMFPAFTSATPGLRAPAQVTRQDMKMIKLPAPFAGLRVACVSDLHLDPNARAPVIRARLQPLATLNADVILFLGDYATGWPRFEDEAAPIIAEQRAPLGVYAVLGNHDRWLGEAHSLDVLREAGVRVLVNESVALERGGAKLYLAGLNDPSTGAGDLDAALAQVPPGACVILMSHTPDVIEEAEARGVALVVAGHTHGGQVNLPLFGPPVVRSRYGSRYAHGLFYEGRTAMFVTRGVGEIAPYVRFNCPREIALLKLVSGQQ